MGLADDEAVAWLELAAEDKGRGAHLVGPPARSVGELFARDEQKIKQAIN